MRLYLVFLLAFMLFGINGNILKEINFNFDYLKFYYYKMPMLMQESLI